MVIYLDISHLKNIFWPHIFIGASFQILDSQQVACGSNSAMPRFSRGDHGTLNQNPIFENAFSEQAKQSKLCKALKKSLNLNITKEDFYHVQRENY